MRLSDQHPQRDLIESLRPALRQGREIRVGGKGQVHAQIPRKPGVVEAGFVDLRGGGFLTRTEAARLLGIAGIESLHSQILIRLQAESKDNR